MRPEHIAFDPSDAFHAHVDFLLTLWCWECLQEFEPADWGESNESFHQWCADPSERANAAGWIMIDERPYCPNCALRRRLQN
ncbi:MAG TPA: hypothetical protein VIL86_06800 [Tepidisphaeraceae bacterium]|jgi:hypothetical protein